MRDAINLLNG